MHVRIDSLADHPELFDTVIGWHWHEWSADEPGETLEQWRDRLVSRSQAEGIPFTLVAFVDDQPYGCITVCDDDKHARFTDKTPWISGMFVRGTARNLGAGRALIEAAEDRARALGFDALWVWTTEAAPFYQRCGYQVIAKKESLRESTVLRHELRTGQFHFNPGTYGETVRAEVPAYDELQRVIADAAREIHVHRALDLGTGTGETMRRVAGVHRHARIVGIDENDGMLAVAREVVPAADLRVARLQEELPGGSFDLVFSSLAVHHLDADEKQDLFRRVAERLGDGGRFVLGDLVVPDDPVHVVTEIDGDYDKPSGLAEQLAWLEAAGLRPSVRWHDKDLAVIVADKI